MLSGNKVSDTYKIEQFFLKFTMIFDLISAIICALAGIYVDSNAVIFDSIYCFFLVFGSFILVIISRKRLTPPNKNFQYGYDKLEPLMIFIQAGVILISCIYATLTAIRDLFHPYELHNFSLIASLELSLFVICFIMSFICNYYATRYKSHILKLEQLFWWTDSLQSLILGLAFSFGLISKSIHMEWLTPYIDPIALIFLVLSIIREPLFYIRKSLVELLDGVYPEKTHADIESTIKEFLEKRRLEVSDLRFRQAGKKMFIRVMYLPRADINAEKLAKVQQDLNSFLKTTLFNYIFDAILVVDDSRIVK